MANESKNSNKDFLQLMLLDLEQIIHEAQPVISRLQVKVLAAVALLCGHEANGITGCTYKEVRIATQISDEMLSKTLQFLCAEELVIKADNVHDRRQSRYLVTQTGLALIGTLDERMVTLLGDWLGRALRK